MASRGSAILRGVGGGLRLAAPAHVAASFFRAAVSAAGQVGLGGAVTRGFSTWGCGGVGVPAGGVNAAGKSGLWMRPAALSMDGERSLYTKKKKKQFDPTIVGVRRAGQEQFGKDATARLRKATTLVAGRIQDSKHNKIHVAVERSILDRIERMRNRFNCVFHVKLDGEEETIPVIIRSMQQHPTKEFIQHVDMVRFEPDRGMEMSIPIVVVAEDRSPGIKRGGVVNQVLRELKVIVRSPEIPKVINADISTLDVGERLWLDQVEMPPGLEIAPLPHYKKCPAVTVQSTRVSILAARALAEAEEGGGGGKKKK